MTPVNLKPKCFYNGIENEQCPNNKNNICRTVYPTIESFMSLYHPFDGKNYIKCLCG